MPVHLTILRVLGWTWEDALDEAEDSDGWSKCIACCAALHEKDEGLR